MSAIPQAMASAFCAMPVRTFRHLAGFAIVAGGVAVLGLRAAALVHL